MVYKINTEILVVNLKGIIISVIIALLAIIFFAHNLRAVIAIVAITLALLMPQIYLAIQYKKYTNYSSFEIDYEKELFIIKKPNIIVEKKFDEIKTIQYHKAFVPPSYLSLAFSLSQHFYYYRIEFTDGTVYYLTNLLTPNPQIKEDGVFYPYYFKVDRKYATIKP
jgi:hypothetical protein